jgi:hypothetical protein
MVASSNEALLVAACCEAPSVECSVLAKELIQFTDDGQCESSEPLTWIQEYLTAHLTLVSWTQVHTRVIFSLSKKKRKCMERALQRSTERSCKAEAWAELFKHVTIDEQLDPCSSECSAKTKGNMTMYLHFARKMYMKAYGNRVPSMLGLFMMTNFNGTVLRKLLAHKYWTGMLTKQERECLVEDLLGYSVCLEDRTELMMEYTRLMRSLRVDDALLDCLSGTLARPDKQQCFTADTKADDDKPMRSLDDISDDDDEDDARRIVASGEPSQAAIIGGACGVKKKQQRRNCSAAHEPTEPCVTAPMPRAALCPQPWSSSIEAMVDSLPSVKRFREQMGLGCFIDARQVLQYFYLANFGAEDTWRTIAYERLAANEALLDRMARYRTNALPAHVSADEWMRVTMVFYTSTDAQRADMDKLAQVMQFKAALTGIVAPRILKQTQGVTALQQLITIYMPDWDVLWRNMQWVTGSEVMHAIADYKKTQPELRQETVDAILELLPQM